MCVCVVRVVSTGRRVWAGTSVVVLDVITSSSICCCFPCKRGWLYSIVFFTVQLLFNFTVSHFQHVFWLRIFFFFLLIQARHQHIIFMTMKGLILNAFYFCMCLCVLRAFILNYITLNQMSFWNPGKRKFLTLQRVAVKTFSSQQPPLTGLRDNLSIQT